MIPPRRTRAAAAQHLYTSMRASTTSTGYTDSPDNAWRQYMGAGLGRPTSSPSVAPSTGKRKASHSTETGSQQVNGLRQSKRGRALDGDSLDVSLEEPRFTQKEEDPFSAYRSPTPSLASSVAAPSSIASTRTVRTISPSSPSSKVGRLASPTEKLCLSELLERPIKPLRRSLAAKATTPPPAPRLPIPIHVEVEVNDATSSVGTTASSGPSTNSGSNTSQTSQDSRMTIKADVPMTAKARKEARTPRPPNAWILYRSDQLKVIREDPVFSRKTQADISKLIAALWREEGPEVKLWYEQQADLKKVEHFQKYPEYKFSPQPRKKLNRSTDSDVLSMSTSSAGGKKSKKLATSTSTVASDDGASSIAASPGQRRAVKAGPPQSTYYPVVEAPLSSFYTDLEVTPQACITEYADPPSPTPQRHAIPPHQFELPPITLPSAEAGYELYSPAIGVPDGLTPSPAFPNSSTGLPSPLMTGSSYGDAFALTPTAPSMSNNTSWSSAPTGGISPSALPIASAAEIDALLASLGSEAGTASILSENSTAGDEAWNAFLGSGFSYASNLDRTLTHRLASASYGIQPPSTSSASDFVAGPEEYAGEGCDWLHDPYVPKRGRSDDSELPWLLEDDNGNDEEQWGRAL